MSKAAAPPTTSTASTDPFSGQDPFSSDPFASMERKEGGQVSSHTHTHINIVHSSLNGGSQLYWVTVRSYYLFPGHTHTHTHTHMQTGWGAFSTDPFASQTSSDPFSSGDPFGDDPFSRQSAPRADNVFQQPPSQSSQDIKVPDPLPKVSTPYMP